MCDPITYCVDIEKRKPICVKANQKASETMKSCHEASKEVLGQSSFEPQDKISDKGKYSIKDENGIGSYLYSIYDSKDYYDREQNYKSKMKELDAKCDSGSLKERSGFFSAFSGKAAMCTSYKKDPAQACQSLISANESAFDGKERMIKKICNDQKTTQVCTTLNAQRLHLIAKNIGTREAFNDQKKAVEADSEQ